MIFKNNSKDLVSAQTAVNIAEGDFYLHDKSTRENLEEADENLIRYLKKCIEENGFEVASPEIDRHYWRNLETIEKNHDIKRENLYRNAFLGYNMETFEMIIEDIKKEPNKLELHKKLIKKINKLIVVNAYSSRSYINRIMNLNLERNIINLYKHKIQLQNCNLCWIGDKIL